MYQIQILYLCNSRSDGGERMELVDRFVVFHVISKIEIGHLNL